MPGTKKLASEIAEEAELMAMRLIAVTFLAVIVISIFAC